jgi:hypothetical protein
LLNLRSSWLLPELKTWMEEHEHESIRQMQGSMSQKSVADPNSFLPGELPQGTKFLFAAGVSGRPAATPAAPAPRRGRR